VNKNNLKYIYLITPFIAGFIAWKVSGIIELGAFIMIGGIIMNYYFIKKHP
jgi:hypothetical protein